MDRRSTLLALGGAVPLLVAGRALHAASPDTTEPISANDAKTQTLQYGTLSKATSVTAFNRTGNTFVRDFARCEIIEQDNIAMALTSVAVPPPAPLTDAQHAILHLVNSAPDATFDAVYLKSQIIGHTSLLEIQLDLLASGLPLTSDAIHIALISKAFIENHLLVLRLLYADNA